MEMLDYNWCIDDVVNFHKSCVELRNPFELTSIESVIIQSLGEWIIFSLPGLMGPRVREFVESIRRFIYPQYGNVIVDPPGYPLLGRRPGDGFHIGYSAYEGKWS